MENKYDNFKFRCSSLGKLMVNPRSKSEKLSETTKSYLKELWIENEFGRRKEITSKFLEKGTKVEEDSIDLASRVLDVFLVKNIKHYENDFIQGTPDIVLDEVIDIKSAWDIFSFANVDGVSSDYYWQLLGYTDLTSLSIARLCYTLVDTPIELILDQVRVTAYREGNQFNDDRIAELEFEYEKKMTYQDIPEEKRVKLFEVVKSEKDIKALYERIKDCREYMNNLSL